MFCQNILIELRRPRRFTLPAVRSPLPRYSADRMAWWERLSPARDQAAVGRRARNDEPAAVQQRMASCGLGARKLDVVFGPRAIRRDSSDALAVSTTAAACSIVIRAPHRCPPPRAGGALGFPWTDPGLDPRPTVFLATGSGRSAFRTIAPHLRSEGLGACAPGGRPRGRHSRARARDPQPDRDTCASRPESNARAGNADAPASPCCRTRPHNRRDGGRTPRQADRAVQWRPASSRRLDGHGQAADWSIHIFVAVFYCAGMPRSE
jgi:hypothetical protein